MPRAPVRIRLESSPFTVRSSQFPARRAERLRRAKGAALEGRKRSALPIAIGVASEAALHGLDQLLIEPFAFRRWKNVELRVDVLNFTNQQNWAVVSTNNGTNQVYPEMPLQVLGTVRVKF
ncbi:MAG: hypothetical protein JO232_14125 [Verrucomicrobia bacterium]|nr:hypothetical protein [Verrucomicrobiota bacterium]